MGILDCATLVNRKFQDEMVEVVVYFNGMLLVVQTEAADSPDVFPG